MHGPITIIDDLLGMVECPVSALCRVPRIRAGRRIALAHRRGETRVSYISSEAAVPLPPKLAIPAAHRHPDFDFDIGVGGGPERSDDAAEGRRDLVQMRYFLTGLQIRRRKCTCVYAFSQSDADIRQRHLFEIGAFLRGST